MTTIPNINIVIQQGNLGNEAQQLRTHPSDPQEVQNTRIPEIENRQQTTVQETPETETAGFDREPLSGRESGKQKERRQHGAEKKKKHRNEDDPDSSGYILDTVV